MTAKAQTGHTPPFDTDPDSYTVQSCCLAYGGNSFSGPMKEALKVHLSILKKRYPALEAHDQLVAALRGIANVQLEPDNPFMLMQAFRRIKKQAEAALRAAGEELP